MTDEPEPPSEPPPPPAQPPAAPPSSAAPAAAPPAGQPPTGAPPSDAWAQPAATTSAPTWTPQHTPQKTNPAAIVSLVFGIAQFVICPIVGAIVAIITGHVASSQINRSNGREGGKGLARAGMILGYVGLGLAILGLIGAVIAFGVFGDDISRAVLRDEAREFVENAQDDARVSGGEVRDAEVLSRAYINTSFDTADSVVLADGTPVLDADDADWENSDWRVQMEGEFFRSADICVTIPESLEADPAISDGECSSGSTATRLRVTHRRR